MPFDDAHDAELMRVVIDAQLEWRVRAPLSRHRAPRFHGVISRAS
jgi:hypothetical protein